MYIYMYTYIITCMFPAYFMFIRFLLLFEGGESDRLSGTRQLQYYTMIWCNSSYYYIIL